MTAPSTPGVDQAQDVDSECILNDDEIATIDGSRHNVATATGPNFTTPQVHFDFVRFLLSSSSFWRWPQTTVVSFNYTNTE